MSDGSIRHGGSRGLPGQGSVTSRPELWEIASTETSKVMNLLGYGLGIRQARRDAFIERDKMMNVVVKCLATEITVGSKAEGLTSILESDIDVMKVLEGVIFLKDGVDARKFPRELTVFRSYSAMTYPGHCRLLLERKWSMINKAVANCLVDDGFGRELLCSGLFAGTISTAHMQDTVRHDRAGPSTPVTMNGKVDYDLVPALRYCCPSILKTWASRSRHWPPPNVVQQVVSLGAFVTPVGFKGSENEHVEWRINFNTGENKLVHCLNDTQIKLYVLLKMVNKDVLKPRKKELTSYKMKNIVLWIAENNPETLFNEHSLLHWLHKGLCAILVALETLKLPYYMIPERNLMENCGLENETERKRVWMSTITEMMNEGPRVILRLPKIRQALIAHPEPLRWFSKRKIELELLELNRMMKEYEDVNENQLTHVILREIERRKIEIWSDIYIRMYMEGHRVYSLEDLSDRLLM